MVLECNLELTELNAKSIARSETASQQSCASDKASSQTCSFAGSFHDGTRRILWFCLDTEPSTLGSFNDASTVTIWRRDDEIEKRLLRG